MQWLIEFLGSEYFFFICSNCCDLKKPFCSVSELSGVISDLRNKISDICKQVYNFQSNLREYLPGTSNCTTKIGELGDAVYSSVSDTLTSAEVSASTMTPVMYSAIVSGNISKIVNTVVAISIREHLIADQGKVSVAVHNMRKHGNDVRKYARTC